MRATLDRLTVIAFAIVFYTVLYFTVREWAGWIIHSASSNRDFWGDAIGVAGLLNIPVVVMFGLVSAILILFEFFSLKIIPATCHYPPDRLWILCFSVGFGLLFGLLLSFGWLLLLSVILAGVTILARKAYECLVKYSVIPPPSGK